MIIQRNPSTAFIYHSEAMGASDKNETIYIAETESSKIYTLNGVGLVVWEIIQSPKTPEEIIHEIINVYNIDSKTATETITSFLNTLEQQKLIEYIE